MNEASNRPRAGTGAPHVPLAGRVWGSGARRFVLVHGLGVASRLVAPLGVRLGAHGSVVAPDLPGFGASADQPALSLHGQAGLLAERFRDGADRTLLVGCSLGAQIALHAAAALGDQLGALVLVSPTGDPRRRSMTQHALRLPLEWASQPTQLMRVQGQDHRAAGVGRVLGIFRESLADAPEQVLDRIHAPTLVVRGTRDPVVSTRWASQLAHGVPDGRLLVIPGRHAMTFTEPALLADAILDHARRAVGPDLELADAPPAHAPTAHAPTTDVTSSTTRSER